MSRKKILIIFILIFVGLAVYVVFRPQELITNYRPPTDPEAYSWTIIPFGEDPSGNPKMAVTLKVKGRSYPAGVYTGTCKVVGNSERGIGGEFRNENEITRVQCWYAGAGDEIGVFQEKNDVVLMKGELGEGVGDSPMFRGNFRAITTI